MRNAFPQDAGILLMCILKKADIYFKTRLLQLYNSFNTLMNHSLKADFIEIFQQVHERKFNFEVLRYFNNF